MLAACRAHGWPLHPYRDPAHPLQQRIAELVGAGRERRSTAAASRRSRCRSRAWPSAVHDASRRGSVAAMRARPELIGGAGADDTELMRRAAGLDREARRRGSLLRALAGRCRLGVQGRGRRVHARCGPRSARCSASTRSETVPLRNSLDEVVGSISMKVFIVSDMEGVAGIVKWQQVTGGHAMYEEGRRLYTGEINAAVRGAKAAGATEIVVMDCHGAGEGWTFNSLIPEELDPDCEYVVQNEWTEYTEYLEAGSTRRSSSACTRWRARATACSPTRSAARPGGVCASTASRWARPGSTLRSAARGAARSPLVTGDEASCREGTALLGDGLTTVAVKKGLGRFSARQFPAPKARELIEAGARRVARRSEGGRAVRPRLAVRDPRRLQHLGSRREVPLPRGCRDHRVASDRLARRRLVDRLAAVLLLA